MESYGAQHGYLECNDLENGEGVLKLVKAELQEVHRGAVTCEAPPVVPTPHRRPPVLLRHPEWVPAAEFLSLLPCEV
jgi:hypothetical protein